jgi:uncharacterized protein YkwD
MVDVRFLKNYIFCAICIITIIGCSKKAEEQISPSNEIVLGVEKVTMLDLINKYRTSGCTCGTDKMPAVAKLIWNDKLGQAAFKHTKDMAQNNYFSHTSQDGRELDDRINAEKYTWSTLGENIANGQTTENQVMESWIKSPGHCKNIMNGNFVEVGFARVQNYWTQNFGKSK